MPLTRNHTRVNAHAIADVGECTLPCDARAVKQPEKVARLVDQFAVERDDYIALVQPRSLPGCPALWLACNQFPTALAPSGALLSNKLPMSRGDSQRAASYGAGACLEH